jgi:cysteine-rich repeat protein
MRTRLAIVVVLAGACGDGKVNGEEGSSSEGSSSAGSTMPGTESSTEVGGSSSSIGTVADSSSSGGGAVCGDGVVEGDEPCDDGNDIDDDACSNDCMSHCALAWEAVIDPEPTMVQSIAQVVRDDAGDLVMAGTIEPLSGDTPPTALWVGKYDADGNEIWSGVRGPDGTRAVGIAVDDAGAIYVAAETISDAGDIDGLVLALDADGNEGWSRVVSGMLGDDDGVTGIAVADDGDPVMIATIADVDLESDALVAKLAAADGSDVWTRNLTGTPNPVTGFSIDKGGHIAIDAGGDAVVSWSLYVDFDSTLGTVTRLAIADGNTVWENAMLGGAANGREEISESIAIGPDGEIVVDYQDCGGGVCFSNIYLVPGDGTDAEVFDVLQFMGDGEEALFADGATFDDDGVLVIGGNFQEHATNEFHAWFARIAADGTTICQGRHRHDDDGFAWILTTSVAVGQAGQTVLSGSLVPTDGFMGTNNHGPMWLAAFTP